MELKDTFNQIHDRIDAACRASGRSPNEITLIAVTKTVNIESIEEAVELGQVVFGESKLQEAIPKVEALGTRAEWHFIGKLQSNKARKVAELFNAIHTIENDRQLNEIAKQEKVVDVFVEVNIGEEPQKSGILPSQVGEFVKVVLKCPQVNFRGLMTIGPNLQNGEVLRPYFRRMRKLNEEVGGNWLSMGMSGDFDVAIQEGATHIRVGSALFGARQYN